MNNIQPVIKWSGSKRHQAGEIVSRMPKQIETYYEPFCGGASVFIRLATSEENRVERFVLSDINEDLINLWNKIKSSPIEIYEHYAILWKEMKSIGEWEEKKQYFYGVRDRFNKDKSPLDFMFLMRTAFNGLPRYNSSGTFNTPLHPNRNGIIPESLLNILMWWNEILKLKDVEFILQSYENVSTSKKDFIYLDPPYFGASGMYFGRLDSYETLWNFLRRQRGKWLLSFDGKTTSKTMSVKIPDDVYKSHEFLYDGNSSFSRLKGKKSEYVFDSLYGN